MPGPRSPAEVEHVPHGRTAQRLQWAHLPPEVRSLVEDRLGAPVVEARSQGAGFTPGFASRLLTQDGSRAFVKAASKRAQRPIAAAYAEEGRKRALLPTGVPAPELTWMHEGDGWVVLAFEDVEGRNPHRPWRTDELMRCLDTLVVVDRLLEEAPSAWDATPLHEDLPTLVTGWDVVAATTPSWPHLDEVRALARSYLDLPQLDRVVHADARDDNFILTADGCALLCDWNWPALAPAWLDAVDLLVEASAEGLDVEPLLAACPLTSGVPADHLDAWVAALCGFMLEADTRPVPSSSPYLGRHRQWWAAATWAWLVSRRGWSDVIPDGASGPHRV